MDRRPLPPRHKSTRENPLVREIRIVLSKLGIPVWRNHVSLSPQASGQMARTGLAKGSADLIGVVPPLGRFIAIEVKRPDGGRVEKHQQDWLDVVRRAGGVAGVARSVDDALALAAEARRPFVPSEAA